MILGRRPKFDWISLLVLVLIPTFFWILGLFLVRWLAIHPPS